MQVNLAYPCFRVTLNKEVAIIQKRKKKKSSSKPHHTMNDSSISTKGTTETVESRDSTPIRDLPSSRDQTPATRALSHLSPHNPNEQTIAVGDSSSIKQFLTICLVYVSGTYSTPQRLVDRIHKPDPSKKIDLTWWVLFFLTNLFVTFPVLCLIGAVGKWRRSVLVVDEGETGELLV